MLIKISVIPGWSVGYLPGAHETAEKLRRSSQIYAIVCCSEQVISYSEPKPIFTEKLNLAELIYD